MNPARISRNEGFSLVEVSLAILVVAVGILSAMALSPPGLDATREAVEDTHTALFAEEVLNGYRSLAEVLQNWTLLDTWPLVGPGEGIWENYDDLTVIPDNTIRANVYQRINSDIVEYAVRYRLRIASLPATNNDIKFVRLEVWNGEFGSDADPTVYYTEIYRPKI